MNENLNFAQYTKVAPNSYGLTDEDILYTDDNLLGQFLSLKKIAPYRSDEGKVDMKKLQRNKQLIQKQSSNINVYILF